MIKKPEKSVGINKVSGDMTFIPEGQLVMGDDPANQKKILVKGFYLDIFEVTNLQFKKFIQETNRKRPIPVTWSKEKVYPLILSLDQHPVVDVDWFMAKEYCAWLGKRLPTEEEWERAARGNDNRKYPWGDNFDVSRANTIETKMQGTLPIGTFQEGVGPFGQYDLTGNVWEWTATPYFPQATDKKDAPEFMVIRGGSYAMGMYPYGMTTYRHYYPKSHYQSGINNSMSDLDIGFRCAK